MRVLTAFSILVAACTSEPALGGAFVSLSDEPTDVRDTFDRGAYAGGEPEVVSVQSILPAPDYRIDMGGGEVVVFPSSIEARLRIEAGDSRGGEIVFRGPLSNGLCGHLESDAAEVGCVMMAFTPDGISVGDLWAVLTANQTGPELGAVTTMAGRRLPAGTDPEAALRDMQAFLER